MKDEQNNYSGGGDSDGHNTLPEEKPNKRQIKTVFPRAAAQLALESLLANKVKGDTITAREVEDGTGYPVEKMRRALRRWERSKNFKLIPVPGDGYRIALDVDNADVVRKSTESERRKAQEALRVVMITDRAKLDDQQVRRIDFLAPRVAMRAATLDRDVKETRKEFKLSERVPLRVIGDGRSTEKI